MFLFTAFNTHSHLPPTNPKGRMTGKDGKTKFTIENATRTRIVIADSKIHILGSVGNIKVARDALVRLVLGMSSLYLSILMLHS